MTDTLFPAFDQAAQSKPPAQRHSPTSVAAADSIEPTCAVQRFAVYEAIRTAYSYGLTDEEGTETTGIPASSWRPRRCELVASGHVADSGRTRLTRAGRKAAVWIVVKRVYP